MKIKFETEYECHCTTPCPYGFMDGYTGELKKVGSNACSDCTHFKSIDLENNEVECKADLICHNPKSNTQ